MNVAVGSAGAVAVGGKGVLAGCAGGWLEQAVTRNIRIVGGKKFMCLTLYSKSD